MSERRFIEQFEDNVRLYPEKVILRDQDTCLTFRELDELSGRVYAYLKKKGIGREDFVMIVLPHGVKFVVAMLGVWKAGAAFVLCEEWEPKDRIKFIYNDCQCKISITREVWDDVTGCDSCSGYVLSDKHDAAYILYTSGSQGMPKGVVHEYGKIEKTTSSVIANGYSVYQHNDRVGMPLPMSSTGGFIHTISPLNVGAYIDILPLSLVGEVEEMERYLNQEKITVSGLVPSMITGRKIHTPYIKIFLTGSEMTSNIYMEEYPILNMYGQTETSVNPLNFVIDRPYENTPVGRASDGKGVYLLNDDDTPVLQGEKGELCVANDFTRGYINLPEQTAEVFRNGLFHTGDIARINEDGNYVILGRKTDMIKINGNRIEPAEIEAAVKRVLNIDWAFAKGFVEPERSFICVYYTADINIDYAHVREELMKILPTYMIPSYFVHIDSIPHLPNGKVDRQAFKAPEVADYIADYIPPTNELEERLCQAMQQVLSVERIGINDDFYLLGGDSLRTIRLVALCDIEGLNVSDIYTSRTPSRIAERWIKKQIMNN